MGVLACCAVGCAPENEPEDTAEGGGARADYAEYVLEHRRWEETFVGCLRDAGLSPVQNRQGGWEGFSAPNRPSEGGLDAACLAEAGPVPVNPPFDQDMIGQLYDAELAMAECLSEHGYPVEEPSTRESFVEAYESGPPWLAMSEVVRAYGQHELENEVLVDCPYLDPRDLFAPDR